MINENEMVYLVRTRELINTYKVLVGTPEGRRARTVEDNIKMNLNRASENAVDSSGFG
jgi:hypothetical protein